MVEIRVWYLVSSAQFECDRSILVQNDISDYETVAHLWLDVVSYLDKLTLVVSTVETINLLSFCMTTERPHFGEEGQTT